MAGKMKYVPACPPGAAPCRCGSGAIWCTVCGQNQAPSPYVDPNDPRWYQGFKYEEAHIPTERLGVPTAPARCECGSGSNEASGAHSHWCPRWVSK